MALLIRVLVALLCLTCTNCCTHFVMNYTAPELQLSVRTMDLSSQEEFVVHSFPRGASSNVLGNSWTSKYGYVGFTPESIQALGKRWSIDHFNLKFLSARDVVAEGLNEAGLSCGMLALTDAKFEKPSMVPSRNLFSLSLCKWALENFEVVSEVLVALSSVSVFFDSGQHFALADASGGVGVVEYLRGELSVYRDENDNKNGFGVLTNEPPFSWQIRSVQHQQWKQSLARSAVSIPGNFYPDERFLRVHMIKHAIESSAQPTTYRDAVAKAVAIVNTVTVPMGNIPGTDSGSSSGEGAGDHTQWAVIRDHAAGNCSYFLRSQLNPSWRRIRFSDLSLQPGQSVKSLVIDDDPWFIDVTNRFA